MFFHYTYSGMPKSEHVWISDRPLLFSTKFISNTKSPEIRIFCSDFRQNFVSEIRTPIAQMEQMFGFQTFFVSFSGSLGPKKGLKLGLNWLGMLDFYSKGLKDHLIGY